MSEQLVIKVDGRPAPQGSKEQGSAGQLLESSKYLAPWRQRIKKAVYARYKELGVTPAELPYFVGPVRLSCTFHVDTGQRIDSPPDIDKLLRGLMDALTAARAWEDDGRVVSVHELHKRQASNGQTGADIVIIGERGAVL